MTRVKRGTTHHQKREAILKKTKGFRWGRKSKLRLAKDALRHALVNSYRDRKRKKADFRGLWQNQIGAACRQSNISYSQFMGRMIKKGILIDRKILSQLAKEYPDTFKALVAECASEESVEK